LRIQLLEFVSDFAGIMAFQTATSLSPAQT